MSTIEMALQVKTSARLAVISEMQDWLAAFRHLTDTEIAAIDRERLRNRLERFVEDLLDAHLADGIEDVPRDTFSTLIAEIERI